MKESNFIPYAEALAMKELGFDEECLTWFRDGELVTWVEDDFDVSYPGDSKFIGYTNSDLHDIVTAPLYQQAFKWFRDKHFMMHLISPYEFKCEIEFLDDFSDSEQYGRFYNHIHLCDDDGDELKFKTYEEAELACLRKLIELVKSN